MKGNPLIEVLFTDEKPSFPSILKRIRQQAGLTQQALAAAVNLSRVQVARLENGTRQPSLAMAQRLATALGKSLSVFDTKEPHAHP